MQAIPHPGGYSRLFLFSRSAERRSADLREIAAQFRVASAAMGAGQAYRQFGGGGGFCPGRAYRRHGGGGGLSSARPGAGLSSARSGPICPLPQIPHRRHGAGEAYRRLGAGLSVHCHKFLLAGFCPGEAYRLLGTHRQLLPGAGLIVCSERAYLPICHRSWGESFDPGA
jgi:hypothetical protein